MATQLADPLNDRLVVLISKADKTRLMARAKAAGLSLSDYVRAAAERFEIEEELPKDFEAELLRQIEQIRKRMQAALDDLDAYLAERREPDRAAIRAKTFAELEQLEIDWDEVRAVLGLNG